MTKTAVIIGAGPAGLTAAYMMLKNMDIKPIVIEELNAAGGIARTVFHNGNGIDLGGHRLFSKNQSILDLWEELLPLQGEPSIDDKILDRTPVELSTGGPDPDETDIVMLKRRRLSRIYYLKKFFNYPISLSLDTILNMGLLRTTKAGFSYIKSCFIKNKEVTLEDFMINRFGVVLYKTFFEKYTQKVWGLHPREISKEWGEQRIKGLSLAKAVLNALLSPLHLINNKQKETSLIDQFYYPKYGCGELWNIMADKIIQMGGEIRYGQQVTGFVNSCDTITGIKVNANGKEDLFNADYVLSSMPVKDLIAGLQNVPQNIREIAENLQYRDYILAGFYLDKFNLKNNTKIKTINNICPDTWIYLQDENLTAGRLQIMNNWSPYLVKDFQNKVFISLEYFATEGDELWSKTEDDMFKTALEDIKKLGLTEEEHILDKVIIKVKKAYPAYFGAYSRFDEVKDYLSRFNNLYCIGRNGQHKYNNMDHSMLSGIEAVNCIKTGAGKDILWEVNTEKKYHEG